MRNFFTGTKFKITLAVLLSLFLGVFVAAVSTSGSSPVSSALGFIMTPLENAAASFADMMSDFNGYFVSSKSYADKIDELKEENALLRSQLVDYEKTLHKLEAYEEFLDVKDKNPDFSFVPSQIILKDTSDVFGSFTLNKGLSDGVNVNDPVIYGEALVGIVKTVTENNCTVYSLFNPEVSVSAYEIRTREDCYTESEISVSRNGFIRLSGLTKTTAVVSGGIVCTSGIGGIYPMDLIIGTVKEIKTDETGLSVYALIEPEADYSQITDVFIITEFQGKNG
ncbi:MAG: rod shape-determining protein MreC [Clostridia bacterium]|nr:rod shape-determining protein MreC [Clostridia bacterium]